MSAPKTDIDKQEQHHKPALWGIRGAMIFAGVLLLALITWLAYQGRSRVSPMPISMGALAPKFLSNDPFRLAMIR